MNRSLLLLTLGALSGCGGGQTDPDRPPASSGDIALPSGYRIDLIAEGLDFPSGIAFDEAGAPYVVEAGYSYGEVFTVPRLVALGPNGERRTVYEGQNPPWNGVTFGGGRFFIAEGSQLAPGRILAVDKQGRAAEVVTGLPSLGDHHTDGPLYGPDGFLYWGQGTATNSGVVGPDNAEFGWLHRFPDFHDIPCQDVVLSGQNFESENPLTEPGGDEAVTGAYLPFGTPSSPGQVIAGQVPCTGAILRMRPPDEAAPGGGAVPPIELFAWGFRNPFGLAFGPDNRLYTTENGFDERGSRSIFGAGDIVWRVEQGRWYGWPDFSGGRPVDSDRFDPPTREMPRRLLERQPGEVPQPLAFLGVHSSSNGFDISRSEAFGFVGEAFIAQFGDMAPGVGRVVGPVGFKVIRVNLATGVEKDFAANAGDRNGPASYLESGGLERPVAARFTPDGRELWVVDFGVMTIEASGPAPQPGTGRIWRIRHE